jgi:beta-phosphoglucomutase-like phosphatase (HAD superfamily)
MRKIRLEDYDAVAFDVEGTLADTIPTHHKARKQAFDEHGYGHITSQQHELGPTYGSSTADIIGGVLHAAGEIKQGGPFKEHAVVQDVMASKMQFFGEYAAEGFDAMPGAVDLLRAIAAERIGKAALVTSSRLQFVTPFLERYDLTQYFPDDLIISEDTVEVEGLEGKPSADPYKLAMRRLHAEKLLVFEDTVPGVMSAKKAGAAVIALSFDNESARLFAGNQLEFPPDAVAKDYDEVRKILGIQ